MFMRIVRTHNPSKHGELFNKVKNRLDKQNNQTNASYNSTPDKFKEINAPQSTKQVLNESQKALASISNKQGCNKEEIGGVFNRMIVDYYQNIANI